MHVEIWSDIACPWCYVGKRRFEAALSQWSGAEEVTVSWRSFELDPEAPPERSGDYAAHLAAKYGMPVEDAVRMHEQMTETAAAEGLDFHFDRVRAGNTFDAHRMLHLATEHGLQDAMKERLMRAYFTEGESVADPSTLERLAVEAGVPAEAARETATGDAFAGAVREDERTAAALGINAVPFFVVDRQIAVSGAQQPELFLALLDRAAGAASAS